MKSHQVSRVKALPAPMTHHQTSVPRFARPTLGFLPHHKGIPMGTNRDERIGMPGNIRERVQEWIIVFCSGSTAFIGLWFVEIGAITSSMNHRPNRLGAPDSHEFHPSLLRRLRPEQA